jgi:hypothetical protein
MFDTGFISRGQLCFSKYRVAIDYQARDLILADVHEAHGNFSQLDGQRIACLFFCRTACTSAPARVAVSAWPIIRDCAASDILRTF